MTAGGIQGEEFSPDDFTRRLFSYNVMPFFGIVVRGIEYDDSTRPLEATLSAGGFIGATNKPKRWHLIWDDVSNKNSSDFNAKLLVDYLDLTNKNHQSVWIQWNDNHPKLAIEFWPVIAELAREELYLDVADIMERALSLQTASDALSFQTFLWNRACGAFNKKAADALETNQLQEAVRIYSASLKIRPNNLAFSGRSDAYQALGKLEKSAADLKSAAQYE